MAASMLSMFSLHCFILVLAVGSLTAVGAAAPPPPPTTAPAPAPFLLTSATRLPAPAPAPAPFRFALATPSPAAPSPAMLASLETPTPVIQPPSPTYSSISTSQYHTCALASSNGSAFCWGAGYAAQAGALGLNSTSNSTYPALVYTNQTFFTIAVGGMTTCALSRENNSLWCWGEQAQSLYFAEIFNDPSIAVNLTWAPSLVPSNFSWTDVCLGESHLCAVRNDSTMWCGGENYEDGELGTGTVESYPLSNMGQVVGGDRWVAVSCGSRFTIGLKSSGYAYAFGANSAGQLGIGTTDDAFLPEPVGATLSPPIGPFSFIASGPDSEHACGIEAGTLQAYCWGSNVYGQLGDGTKINRTTPVAVYGDLQWVSLTTGRCHTCGVTTKYNGYCWGCNANYQLGVPGVDVVSEVLAPKQISSATCGSYWTDLTAGLASTCGITPSGKGCCWGGNDEWVCGVAAGAEDRYGDVQQPRSVNSSVKWGVSVPSPPPAPLSPPPPFNPRPPPPPVPPPPPPPPSSSSSTGAIVGGVVGGLVAVGLCVWGYVVCARRQRENVSSNNNSTNNTHSVDSAGDDLKGDAISIPVIGSSLAVLLAWISTTTSMKNAKVVDASSDNGSGTTTTTNGDGGGGVVKKDKRTKVLEIPDHVKHLQFEWSDVEIIRECIGSGSFGQVILAKVKHAKVAVKVLVDARALEEEERRKRALQSSITRSGPKSAVSSGSQETKIDIESGGTDQTISTASTTAVAVTSKEKLMSEVAILASLQHPNVALLMGFCIEPPCLALEYCTRGSLYDVLRQASQDPTSQLAERLTWQRRVQIACDAAAGMLHLHTRSPQIIHRDVKSANFLLTLAFVAKVSEVGASRLVDDAIGSAMWGAGGAGMATATATNGGVTQPRWLAPEVLMNGKATAASDVYSFGIVMWELLTWKLPWENEIVWAIVGQVLQGERPPIPPLEELPGMGLGVARLQPHVEQYIELMKRCWAQEPGDRPTFDEVANELNAINSKMKG